MTTGRIFYLQMDMRRKISFAVCLGEMTQGYTTGNMVQVYV